MASTSASEEETWTDQETVESAPVEEGTSSVPENRLVDKPKAKAAVWRYFGLETDDHGVIKNQELPVCKVGTCRTRVKIKHASTSNLYSHLKMHHPPEYQVIRPKRTKGKGKASSSKAGTIQASFRQATKLHPDSREQKQITKAITYHLAKDMRPVYSVEMPGFRRMVNKLCSA